MNSDKKDIKTPTEASPKDALALQSKGPVLSELKDPPVPTAPAQINLVATSYQLYAAGNYALLLAELKARVIDHALRNPATSEAALRQVPGMDLEGTVEFALSQGFDVSKDVYDEVLVTSVCGCSGVQSCLAHALRINGRPIAPTGLGIACPCEVKGVDVLKPCRAHKEARDHKQPLPVENPSVTATVHARVTSDGAESPAVREWLEAFLDQKLKAPKRAPVAPNIEKLLTAARAAFPIYPIAAVVLAKTGKMVVSVVDRGVQYFDYDVVEDWQELYRRSAWGSLGPDHFPAHLREVFFECQYEGELYDDYGRDDDPREVADLWEPQDYSTPVPSHPNSPRWAPDHDFDKSQQEWPEFKSKGFAAKCGPDAEERVFSRKDHRRDAEARAACCKFELPELEVKEVHMPSSQPLHVIAPMVLRTIEGTFYIPSVTATNKKSARNVWYALFNEQVHDALPGSGLDIKYQAEAACAVAGMPLDTAETLGITYEKSHGRWRATCKIGDYATYTSLWRKTRRESFYSVLCTMFSKPETEPETFAKGGSAGLPAHCASDKDEKALLTTPEAPQSVPTQLQPFFSPLKRPRTPARRLEFVDAKTPYLGSIPAPPPMDSSARGMAQQKMVVIARGIPWDSPLYRPLAEATLAVDREKFLATLSVLPAPPPKVFVMNHAVHRMALGAAYSVLPPERQKAFREYMGWDKVQARYFDKDPTGRSILLTRWDASKFLLDPRDFASFFTVGKVMVPAVSPTEPDSRSPEPKKRRVMPAPCDSGKTPGVVPALLGLIHLSQGAPKPDPKPAHCASGGLPALPAPMEVTVSLRSDEVAPVAPKASTAEVRALLDMLQEAAPAIDPVFDAAPLLPHGTPVVEPTAENVSEFDPIVSSAARLMASSAVSYVVDGGGRTLHQMWQTLEQKGTPQTKVERDLKKKASLLQPIIPKIGKLPANALPIGKERLTADMLKAHRDSVNRYMLPVADLMTNIRQMFPSDSPAFAVIGTKTDKVTGAVTTTKTLNVPTWWRMTVSGPPGDRKAAMKAEYPLLWVDLEHGANGHMRYNPDYETFGYDVQMLIAARTQDALATLSKRPKMKIFGELVEIVNTHFFGTTGLAGQLGRMAKNEKVAVGAHLLNADNSTVSYHEYCEVVNTYFPATPFPYSFCYGSNRHSRHIPLEILALIYGKTEESHMYRKNMHKMFGKSDLVPVWSREEADEHGFTVFDFNPTSSPGPLFNVNLQDLRAALKEKFPAGEWADQQLNNEVTSDTSTCLANRMLSDLHTALTSSEADLAKFYRTYDTMRAAKVVPKPEIYHLDKKEVTRNIFATNNPAYIPAHALINAAKRGHADALEGNCRSLMTYSNAHGGMSDLIDRMLAQTPNVWKFLVYSDNLYLFRPVLRKDGGRDLDWVSLDASSMEASHTYLNILYECHRLAEFAFGVDPRTIQMSLAAAVKAAGKPVGSSAPAERKPPQPQLGKKQTVLNEKQVAAKQEADRPSKPDALGPAFGHYLMRMLPWMVTNTVGILADRQLRVKGMASGVAPTFWFNTGLMTYAGAKAEAYLNAAARTPIDEKGELDEKLNRIFTSLGLKMKVELVAGDPSALRSDKPGLLQLAEVNRVARMDLLGFDLATVKFGPTGTGYRVAVFDRNRLLKTLCWSKAAMNMAALKLDQASSEVLLKLFTWQKLKSIYVSGGWVYENCAELLRSRIIELAFEFRLDTLQPNERSFLEKILTPMWEHLKLDPDHLSSLKSMILSSANPTIAEVVNIMFPEKALLDLLELAKADSRFKQAFLHAKPQAVVVPDSGEDYSFDETDRKKAPPIMKSAAVPVSSSAAGGAPVFTEAPATRRYGRLVDYKTKPTDAQVQTLASFVTSQAALPKSGRKSTLAIMKDFSKVPKSKRTRVFERVLSQYTGLTKALVEQASASLRQNVAFSAAWELLMKEGFAD